MVKKIALVLLVIGGIDMGLIGLFNYDVIATIFGHMTTITRFIYDLVGLSAIYFAFSKSR